MVPERPTAVPLFASLNDNPKRSLPCGRGFCQTHCGLARSEGLSVSCSRPGASGGKQVTSRIAAANAWQQGRFLIMMMVCLFIWLSLVELARLPRRENG